MWQRIAASNLLIISKRSIVNLLLNYVLSSLKTHSKRRKNWYIFNKIIVENNLNDNFSLNLKSLYTKFGKFPVKIYNFFITIHVLSNSKVLIDDKTSNNRVQIVLKLSIEIDPKIFNLL